MSFQTLNLNRRHESDNTYYKFNTSIFRELNPPFGSYRVLSWRSPYPLNKSERWHARGVLCCANLGWYGNALTQLLLQMLGCNMIMQQVCVFFLRYETVFDNQINLLQ